jgi:putative ATP-dependent endonuclease of OLD family
MVKSIQADLRHQVQTSLTKVFSEALASLPKDMKDEQTGEEITRLDLINRTLNACVLGDFGCQLELGFEEPAVDSAIFGSPVLKADDGFQTDIADKGHGLQRTTMLTIVRAYLTLRSQLDAKSPGLGRVIFLIEEPEIYLHPTLRRSAYGLFRELAKEGDQVIYTTHDGYMLDVLHFDEVRVIKRERDAKPAPVTCMDEVSADVLLEVWHRLTGIDKISIESVRARLHRIYDPYRNEGFLSSKVLLCEGDTERLALPIYFRAIGFDLDEHGVALIGAGSVDLLDYFYLMFTEMGIPTYVVWDSDTPDEVDVSTITNKDRKQDILNKSKRNHDLGQLVGVTIEPRKDNCCFCTSETIADRGAVFPKKYEHTMMVTLPDSEEVKGQATRLYGSESKPLAARYYAIEAVGRGTAEGDPSKYVPAFVTQIKAKIEALSAPEKQSVILGIRQPC